MRKTFFLVIVAIVALLSGCKKRPYFQTKDGIEYHFVEHHRSGPSPVLGGGALLDIKVYWKDSLMFSSRELHHDFNVMIKDTAEGSIDRALMMMHQGDSAIFRLNAYNFLTHKVNMAIPKGMTPEDKLTFYIRLKRVLSPEKIAREHEKFLEYRRNLEPQLIDDYIQRHPDYHFQLQPNGLYIARVKDGKGIRPVEGDSVYINYISYFINGEPFASTLKKGKLFGFRIGDEKVIPGLELAVKQMRQGQVAFVIIPSYLAYGKEGLLDLIPPYSPLVFQVELVRVVSQRRAVVWK